MFGIRPVLHVSPHRPFPRVQRLIISWKKECSTIRKQPSLKPRNSMGMRLASCEFVLFFDRSDGSFCLRITRYTIEILPRSFRLVYHVRARRRGRFFGFCTQLNADCPPERTEGFNGTSQDLGAGYFRELRTVRLRKALRKR
mmetsp:Transcript_50310/g.99074  ORF Transcript_50310/g.99074 Transcript_50310/m.99074 type:complete len:142 (+) Transcript_50310:52-477(+)